MFLDLMVLLVSSLISLHNYNTYIYSKNQVYLNKKYKNFINKIYIT